MGMTAAKLAVPELAAVGPALKIAKKFNPFGVLADGEHFDPSLHQEVSADQLEREAYEFERDAQLLEYDAELMRKYKQFDPIGYQ